jgi:hypothetical protein
MFPFSKVTPLTNQARNCGVLYAGQVVGRKPKLVAFAILITQQDFIISKELHSVFLCLNTKKDSDMTYASQCHVAEEAPRPDLNGLVVLAGKDISSVCT